MDNYFYDKTVLVTGGAGFLGSHVVDKLRQIGCRKIIVPRSRKYDLTKEKYVDELFQGNKIDIVIHLASFHGGLYYNISERGYIYYNNVLMNTFLMEYAKRNNVEKFVSAGTVDSYPNNISIPFKEKDIWNGYPEPTSAPYAFSKKLMIVQGRAYRDQYDFNAIHLMFINLYGTRDDFELERCHVIPALIQKIDIAIENHQESIIVFGDGSQRREFLFVEDAAKAVILATKRYNSVEPVNIGTGNDISIKMVVEKIVDIMNYKGKIIWDKSKPTGFPRKCFDVSRAKEKFGFVSEKDFVEGLIETINWYRKNIKKD